METRVIETTEFVGGNLALDFVDSVGGLLATGPLPADELLRSYEDVLFFGVQRGALSERLARELRREAREHPRKAEKAFAEALRRREVLDSVFRPLAHGDTPPGDALDALGEFGAEALAHGRLEERDDGFEWVWDDASDLLTPLWPIGQAALELMTNGPLDRIKGCARCRWLFLDTTKNNSRRWCSASDCGKDAKMERYIARRRERRRRSGGS